MKSSVELLDIKIRVLEHAVSEAKEDEIEELKEKLALLKMYRSSAQ